MCATLWPISAPWDGSYLYDLEPSVQVIKLRFDKNLSTIFESPGTGSRRKRWQASSASLPPWPKTSKALLTGRFLFVGWDAWKNGKSPPSAGGANGWRASHPAHAPGQGPLPSWSFGRGALTLEPFRSRRCARQHPSLVYREEPKVRVSEKWT